MTAAVARSRLLASRSAILATSGADGRPHLVPVVFAAAADGTETLYSAVDAKPKRTRALRRLANVAANPQVALLVEHYDDADWSALWWVRADGTARVLAAGEPEAERALDLLVARYPQYAPVRLGRPGGPVLAVDVDRWSGWSATPG